MAKRQKSARKAASQDDAGDSFLAVTRHILDPGLAALFQSSAGSGTAFQQKKSHNSKHGLSHGPEPTLKPRSSGPSSASRKGIVESSEAEDRSTVSKSKDLKGQRTSRKRARNDGQDDQDDLEGLYLNRLAEEEAKENHNWQSDSSRKRQKIATRQVDTSTVISDHENSSSKGSAQESDLEVESVPSEADDDEHLVPAHEDTNESRIVRHESLSGSNRDSDVEKASRTVFVGNVCTSTIKSKTAKSIFTRYLVSFVPSLPAHEPAHRIESLRFRSTPFSTSAIPKKAAFVKKELMDATAKSTNAYVVYSTPLAAREAVKRLNGSPCLDRHIRLDSVAHPSKTDHKRCVFVGNLGFVDNPQAIDAAEDEESQKKPRKPREPADIEEGLWRTFGRSGKVESVRVIRDPITRVGKGFAYVQFKDANAVEKALLLAGKKFPPMLPRILRVTRAKNIDKTASGAREPKGVSKPSRAASNAVHVAKPDPQRQSLSGRAGKLFGRAGAAKLRGTGSNTTSLGKRGSIKSSVGVKPAAAASMAFEGYRASSAGKKGVKVLPRKGKPQTRSSKRATAFRSGGFKTQRAKVQEQRARGEK